MLYLPTLEDVTETLGRISSIVIKTPLVPYFEKVGGVQDVYLKLENLQNGGSFKIRAGANALLSLSKKQLSKGIYTASAGNFGLGVAIASKKIGVELKVFVPDTASQKKVEALKKLGVGVNFLSFSEWWNILENHKQKGEEGVFLHPVANQAVLSGNATIGLEIMTQMPDVEAILVPFGGGGLITGIASIAKTLNPNVKIFACESQNALPLKAAFEAQEPRRVNMSPSFINGIGSTIVLKDMWPLIKEVVDGTLSAGENKTKLTLKNLVVNNSIITEGAGALPVACLDELKDQFKKVVCVVSGGNIDGATLSEIIGE
jgi:threonine dehydratase